MQIIQSGPTKATLRQAALDDAIGQTISGFQAVEQQAKSKRAEAMAMNEQAQGLRKEGWDVSNEAYAKSLEEKPSKLAKFFGAEEAAPVTWARSKEYVADQDAKKFERNLDTQLKQSQISKNNRYSPKGNGSSGKMGIDGEELPGVASLKGEEKNKVGSIASAYQALSGMENAIKDGHEPEYINSKTPIIGNFVSDNPFTENQRVMSEVIGRLQSGGAIGKEEVQGFNDLGPRAGDDKDTISRKLTSQKSFLNNKLAAYGMKPENLGKMGFDTAPSYVSKNKEWSGSNNAAASSKGSPWSKYGKKP